MKTKNVSVSFWAKKTSTYSVEVRAWFDSTKWNWNVYAHVFNNHALYEDNEALRNLPFHGGCTFDQLKTIKPLEIKYDWQKEREGKTLGCDYSHIYDDYENHPSPFESAFGVIPSPFKYCADELIEALESNNQPPTQ